MSHPEHGIYVQWRGSQPRTEWLVEEGAPGIPERWLQQIWRHQRIDRDRLQTDHGIPIRVLHPGFWNRGAGPDFQEAILSFDGAPATQGNVEIDRVPAGWRQHGHDRNPAFQNVILRVVWNGSPPSGGPPILRLEGRLDTPLETLGPWLDEEAHLLLPNLLVGRCSGPLQLLTRPAMAELLRQAAEVRLSRKADEFAARAGLIGWDRALWEGIFGALGYRANVWPMRRIAEVLSVDGNSGGSSAMAWESRLFGLAGVFTVSPGHRESPRIRELWHGWWRDRDRLADGVLPRNCWKLAGIRPANHPQRRLALAARWIATGNLRSQLEDWIRDGLPDPASSRRLLAAIEPGTDPYWSHHWTLRTAAFAKARPLLGFPRFTDLAMNIFLPWLRARAHADGQSAVIECIQRRYHNWPPSEDNAVLRLARLRLAGPGNATLPRTAAAQQGLLQIAKDFCGRSDALCSRCTLPDLVQRWIQPG
jgi:hypothetical protein